MSLIKEFERSLGSDPEPLLRRLLRSGVRPAELAEALQEYLADEQTVTDEGVLVPNVFRISLGSADHERLSRYGVALPRELGTVVVETVAERGWLLVGPVKVRVERDELIPAGRYRLVGRIEEVEGWGPRPSELAAPVSEPTSDAGTAPATAATTATAAPATASSSAADADPQGLRDPMLEVRTGVDAGARLVLDGGRVTAGRGASCDLVVRDTTVSREHAAFLRRGDAWWVIDLGSTNGTRVNGLRAAEHPITPGDRIELGDVVVELLEA
jgi:hypothetical protein